MMEEFDVILATMKSSADPKRAAGMKAYMRNQFDFFGISSPERKMIFRPFLLNLDKRDHPKDDFIMSCYGDDHRECQYLAMEYLFYFRKKTDPSSIKLINYMITHKSWWDTVDYIASNIVGDLAMRFPILKEDVLDSWITDNHMWLRRTSLLFQLKYKSRTDTDFLEKAISMNLDSREFFINKAIGWALRQYSKTDPVWVTDFVDRNKLQPVSYREAIKYI